MDSAIHTGSVTLGILAGGRATRLCGLDKAWLERDGVPQVLRLSGRFAGRVAAVLVSANQAFARYEAHGLVAIADVVADAGPLGGVDALARSCVTSWLLTLPVDLIGVNECLLESLASAAAEHGAFAVDEDGPQPLVALWPVCLLRPATRAAIQEGELSVQALQQRLRMRPVRFAGVRYGNLNTPADLAAAGMNP